MSKLTKFINHPKWFFQDAFKKRKKFLEKEIKKANKALTYIGVPFHIDVQILEDQVVNFALEINRRANLPDRVMGAAVLKSSLSLDKYLNDLSGHLQSISKAVKENTPHIVFKTTFEVAVTPFNQNIKYVSSSVTTKEKSDNYNEADDKLIPASINISDTLSPRAHNIYLKLMNARSHVIRGI